MASPGGFFRQPSHVALARRGWESNAYPSTTLSRKGSGRDEECEYGGGAGGADDDSEDEEQFVLSVANTPATETAPRLKTWHRPKARESKSAAEVLHSCEEFSDSTSEIATSCSDPAAVEFERSKPIAIEVPTSRKIKADPTSTTPSAPLSARGDLPGGYFPRHEDPDTRVRRPHPFHADITEARRQSLARATEDSSSPHSNTDRKLKHPHASCSAPVVPKVTATATAPATAMAPKSVGGAKDGHSLSYQGTLTSYNPTGAQDNMLPMGKYYPTNWENRKRQKKQQQEQQGKVEHHEYRQGGRQELPRSQNHERQKQTSQQRGQSEKASPPENPSVARVRAPQLALGHSRSDSEAKRRLQQYQRDMITQAALAASQALGGAIQQRGSDNVMQALNRIPVLRSLQLSPGPSSVTGPSALSQPLMTGLMRSPVSPRLQPLGSPGPVTPMDLSANADELGYLGAGASNRPRMPFGVVTAPPAVALNHCQPQMAQQEQESSFPFLTDRV